jgi:hypothetical protein
MSLDPEMEKWRQGWTASPPVDESESPLMESDALLQETRLRKKLVLDIVAAPIFLVGSFIIAWTNRSIEMTIWACCIWIFTIIATVCVLSTWQVLWRASAESVSDFTEAFRARAEASLRTAKFTLWFLVIQDIVAVTWFVADLFVGSVSAPRFVVAMGILLLLNIFFVWRSFKSRRLALAELVAVRACDNRD